MELSGFENTDFIPVVCYISGMVFGHLVLRLALLGYDIPDDWISFLSALRFFVHFYM